MSTERSYAESYSLKFSTVASKETFEIEERSRINIIVPLPACEDQDEDLYILQAFQDFCLFNWF
jgi:hypothetical protein